MPRRSRARSREAAENRLAQRRDRRQHRAARRQVDEAAVRAALRGSKLAADEAIDAVFDAVRHHRPPPQEARYGALFGILVATDEPARVNRFKSLLLRLLKDAPRLVHGEWFEPLWALTGARWIRPLHAWEPSGKGGDSRFRGLVDHLVVEYPVAPFLYSTLHHGPGPDGERLVRLFATLAQGGSMRREGKGILPPPLTRAMLNAFLRSKANLTAMEAVRHTQVLGLGGDKRLAVAVSRTPLGRGFVAHEPFMQTVLQWLVNHPDYPIHQVGPLVDYLTQRRRDHRDLSLSGRSVRSVLADLRQWHAELSVLKAAGDAVFQPAGLTLDAWHKGSPWSVVQLGSAEELLEEGRFMRHCVRTYADACVRGNTAIFGLRHNQRRLLTLEVNLKLRRIVQVRGRFNRMPTPLERAMIGRWASRASLGMRY